MPAEVDQAGRRSVDALLFDLGGVLIGIDPARSFAVWADAAGLPPDALARRLEPDIWYERHERGEISERQWFDVLRRRLGLGVLDDATMVAGWNALLGDELPGMAALLSGAARHRPVFLFSNTNRTHESVWAARHARLLAPISRRFLSYELGLRKPEPRAFAAVAGEIGLAPARILFFDDSAANVDGARAAGLQAVHVREPADVARALAGLA